MLALIMSKSTKVTQMGCQNGCQNIVKKMGLHLLLMLDVKFYQSQREWVYILFLMVMSTKMGLHSLRMVDVKVYYSQRKNGFTTLANGGCKKLS